MLVALRAAQYGIAPNPEVIEAIHSGDRGLTLDRLKFDSLAWMEFCISIELQSGQEMTPVDIERMTTLVEIEDWLRARL